jgi:hypothetical protein
MKKISLAVLALFVHTVSLFAQVDSSAYKQKKLRIDQVNLVSGYYTQDGNNSAVTGGIGTEKLTDIANTIDLHLVAHDKKYRLHSFTFEMGIDHYTSASSDKIDPGTISSASSSDIRFYPSLNWSVKNEAKNLTVGAGVSYSTEYDYKSIGINANIAKGSADNNREFAAKLQAYFDTWKVILPVELRQNVTTEDGSIGTEPRNSFSASLSYSQVVNQRFQLALLADGVFQSGLLATRYQRVYFTDNSVAVENLPGTRVKIPLGLRAHYFVGSRFILRGYYRFYWDNWGVLAHTVSLEMPVKIGPFVSVSPFYRFYTQSTSKYFSPYRTHDAGEEFYTSDYDLSAFNSQFFGAGVRYVPGKGVLGIRHWYSLELRYGHYIRSTGLHSDIISLDAAFK